ncbi:ABC transporter permease [Streptomyces sp. NBC_01775]|uniref:ABC transporter permease n=1 Tax=Streptomyces sp. NBC_01775 TaxID=2975939 RepID=UPI002DD8E103|nr:ABC transporter permease [Streptomyces sp. NBC_01775]WSB77761.1 ABC transporter permease [Streptomyces sp. NBC_01775]
MSAAKLLAAKGARTHRKAWAAVFAALALTSVLLGAFALTLSSTGLGHARVERYAGADLVVSGDQSTSFTAKPWGSERQTARAGLTSRVRVPEKALGTVRKVPGVRAVVPDAVFTVGIDGRAAAGHPWDAARLAPYGIRDGRAPQRPGEVVLSGPALKEHGTGLGKRVSLRVHGKDARYTVVGAAEGPRAAAYFTGAEARRLAGHPTTVDALGIVAEPGTAAGTLAPRVAHALEKARLDSVGRRADGDAAPLRVLAGDERGDAEFLAVAPARTNTLALLASVAATVVLVALLVVSSTIAQALGQRAHELGLLRAVGATPRQVRGAVGREVGRVAVGAGLAGAVASVPLYLALRALLSAGGALPAGLELPFPPWLALTPLATAGLTVLIARVAAAFACARAGRVRPMEALRDAAPGKARRITGLVLLLLGISSAGTATAQHGQTAAAAAGAAAITMVIACALLGPWIAQGATRVLGAPLRRFGGVGGKLAAANCTASATRLGAAITPIVLVTAFIGVQLGGGATLIHAGGDQAGQALRADLAVRADGGLPDGADRRIRQVPGVRGATSVVPGTAVLARKEAGEPRLERLPALGVTPEDMTSTLDPQVAEGNLNRLRSGTLAVSTERARALDLRPGSTVTLRFDDGQRARLRVVATYERGLALGDFLFSRGQLLRHTSAPGPERALVATAPGADRAAVAEALHTAVPGTRVERDPGPVRVEPEDQALGETLTVAAVAAIGGYTVIAILSTLTLISVGRRPELRLLRLAGAARAQLRRMLRLEAAVTAATGLLVGAAVASVPLLAFSLAMARTVPYLPPVQAVSIVVVVLATTVGGTVPPLWSTLRGHHPRSGGPAGT